ncbi:hypothetical protein HDV63DRAFT_345952 [Trichoderma sp. SZMC 28014]
MEQVPGYRVLASHHCKKAHTHFYAAFRLALRFLTSTLHSHGALRLVNHGANARGNAKVPALGTKQHSLPSVGRIAVPSCVAAISSLTCGLKSTSHLHARTYIWPACTYICLTYRSMGCETPVRTYHALSTGMHRVPSLQPITGSRQPFPSLRPRLTCLSSTASQPGLRIAPTLKPTHRGEGWAPAPIQIAAYREASTPDPIASPCALSRFALLPPFPRPHSAMPMVATRRCPASASARSASPQTTRTRRLNGTAFKYWLGGLCERENSRTSHVPTPHAAPAPQQIPSATTNQHAPVSL